MQRFKVYTKKKFEYELSRIRNEYGLSYWKDITDIMSNECDCFINEHVYKFDTDVRGMMLVIYSTVDVNNDRTREHGCDAVRVVLRWITKNGILYRKVKTHKRIETLFDNLECTIVESLKLSNEELIKGRWTHSEEYDYLKAI